MCFFALLLYPLRKFLLNSSPPSTQPPLTMPKPVPVNIITGFLGVGKTTAIRHMLASKPAGETWAVLVNEFGEVGIDGSLLNGTSGQGGGGEVVIREVPGGCMCCSSGLPMQVALNQLIRRANPDRLLIEPTGLGHPREMLATLDQPMYGDLLQVGATLTLVDARKLADPRYTEHDIFSDQLAIADVIVAAKTDLYEAGDMDLLDSFIAARQLGDRPLYSVSHGAVDPTWLDLERLSLQAQAKTQHPAGSASTNSIDLALVLQFPPSGYVRKDSSGAGFVSAGWIFEPAAVFDHFRLFALFSGVIAERLKAVMITNNGVFGFNLSEQVLSIMELDEASDSRVEIIAETAADFDGIETMLLAARV